MNIISTNCVAGFIYKEILKESYHNPFIWTSVWGNDFLTLIREFDNIDFNKIELSRFGNNLDNNFYLKIDNKIVMRYLHYRFDPKYEKPTVCGIHNNDIRYNKIWEYIVEIYKRRLSKMDMSEERLFIWYDPYKKFLKEVKDLPQLCYEKKQHCLIFSNEKLEENEYVKILTVDDKWGLDWHDGFFNKYGDWLKNYINKKS